MTADTQAQGDVIRFLEALSDPHGSAVYFFDDAFPRPSLFKKAKALAAALQGRGTQEGEPSDAVEDAMAGYLRRCSCGGMPKKDIDLIKRHISEAKRLGYFDRAALAQAQKEQRT